MSLNRTPLYVFAIVVTFVGLGGLVVYLSRTGVFSPEVGALMLVALIGLYVGFAILIILFRLVLRLK